MRLSRILFAIVLTIIGSSHLVNAMSRDSLHAVEQQYRRELIHGTAIGADDTRLSALYEQLGRTYVALGDTMLAEECFNRIDKPKFIDLEYEFYANPIIEKREELQRLLDRQKYDEYADLNRQVIDLVKKYFGIHNFSYFTVLKCQADILSYHCHRPEEGLLAAMELISLKDFYYYKTPDLLCNTYRILLYSLAALGRSAELDKAYAEALPEFRKSTNPLYSPSECRKLIVEGAKAYGHNDIAKKYEKL